MIRDAGVLTSQGADGSAQSARTVATGGVSR